MKRFIFLVFSFVNLYGHPHFFIDSEIIIKDTYVKHIWKFDKLNSRILLFEFDKNKNKIIDEIERFAFITKYFEPLKKDNYNLFIDINDNTEYIAEPKDIDLKIIKRRVQFSFTTDVIIKDGSTICTMDQSIYMAYKLINIDTSYNTQIEKSEYDYCIGVIK